MTPKQAGEEAALEAFGVKNKTTMPPTWAQGRKHTIPSMSESSCKHECRKCAGLTRCQCP